MRPWNEKVETRAFWDTEANGGKGADFLKVQSIKEALQNPGGMKFEDLLRTCAEGLAQVMDAIDQQDFYYHVHQEMTTRPAEPLKVRKPGASPSLGAPYTPAETGPRNTDDDHGNGD